MLLVDNGSVFTKNLLEFLSSRGISHKALVFDRVSAGDIADSDSFILSGRRQNNQQMNALNSKIINHAISERKPLLGICYGAEILALTTGGTIRRMGSLQKGEGSVTVVRENPLCSGIMHVYQSHSYEISRLGSLLVQVARSDRCNYEIVRYQDRSIFGTQFHPEMTSDGLSMIERFAAL